MVPTADHWLWCEFLLSQCIASSIFIRIVSVGIINFSLARRQLLFEGSYNLFHTMQCSNLLLALYIGWGHWLLSVAFASDIYDESLPCSCQFIVLSVALKYGLLHVVDKYCFVFWWLHWVQTEIVINFAVMWPNQPYSFNIISQTFP